MRADLLRRTRQQSLVRRRTVLAERRAVRAEQRAAAVRAGAPRHDRPDPQERPDDP